ncbi:Lar family restriction alleviation protein [Enterobacter asburiae]|uniref:Lar family restriction alleviation protein n=1 Tax=Enterobacter asburiae TaxID=61645 RepID=UPI00069E8E60|nr:Lar family restriction alleviation protein [Enterobacter asburiae]
MKLLPCPFCGGEPEEDGGMFFEFYGHERQDYSIACKKCRAEVRCDVGEHEGADAPCSCHHDTRKICAEKWNRRAAMLQGADVSLTHEGKNHHEDKLGMVNHLGDVTEKVEPVTQIEPVADLYGLTSPTGGETSFTFDAVEARDFIDGGWSCQEYVELERFQEAVSGNSPVIQDGWVMVPVEPTEDMIVNGFESEPDESFSDEKEWEAYEAMSGCQQAAHRAKLCWAAMIAAAPKLE